MAFYTKSKLINALKLGYISYPKNGIEPVFNSNLTRLLGYKNKKALLSSGILRKIYNHIIQNIDLSRDTARPVTLNDTLIKNNENILYVQYHISGREGILEVYVVDRTENELLKQSFKESEDRTNSIFDILVDGIITMNANEIIQYVNPAAEKMFKYSSNELIGKDVKILMPGSDSSLHKKYVKKYLRTGKASIIGIGREELGKKKDGTIFPIYLGVSEVELSGQKIFIGIIHDITIQKNAEEKLLQTVEEIEERIKSGTAELTGTNIRLSEEVADRKRAEDILGREAYIVRQNPGPVFRADYSGVLLFANPAAKKLFGKDVVGKNLISILKGITSSKIKNISSRKPILLEEDIGNKSYLLTLVKDVVSKNLIIYGVDSTRQKLAEINIRLSKEVAERKRTESVLGREAYIVRQNPGPVFRADYSGVLLFANSAAKKLFGKDIVGKNLTSILMGITSSKIKNISSRKQILLEEDIGNKSYLLTFVKDIVSKNLIIYGVDMTDNKLAKEALKRSEYKFKQFFENEPEYCYMISPKGEILDVNIMALKALGYKKEELIGKPLMIIYPKDVHSKVKKNIAVWNKTGILAEREMEIITKKGERRNVLLSASSVRDRDGNLLHSISVQKDITDQIRNQKEKDRLALDLSYRVKELSCLQRISNLIEEEMPISKMFLEITKIVPSGLRHPEKAWARIIFDDLDYIINKKNYDEDFMAGSDIGVSGKLRGILKIGYNDDIDILSEEVDMIHSITRRIGMLIERNELRENLLQQEKLEAIQKLAAAVAHEFNQPLQVLQLLSSAANKENIEREPQILEHIPEQVTKISDLVNKLLNITSFETKLYAQGREIVDIHKAGRK